MRLNGRHQLVVTFLPKAARRAMREVILLRWAMSLRTYLAISNSNGAGLPELSDFCKSSTLKARFTEKGSSFNSGTSAERDNSCDVKDRCKGVIVEVMGKLPRM